MSPQDVVNFIWEYKTTPADEKNEKVSASRDVVRALIDEALYRWPTFFGVKTAEPR